MIKEDRSELLQARFQRGLETLEKIDLVYGVSLDNPNESGKHFLAFVKLVNTQKEKISKLKIMLTGYIKRHYIGEEANNLDDIWLEQNKKYLEKLAVPYEIIYWKNLVESEDFQAAIKKVEAIYKKDAGFRTKFEGVAKTHEKKGTESQIKNYLLEECAFVAYQNCHLTYPEKKPNPACSWIINRYNPNVVFHSHVIEEKTNAKKEKINGLIANASPSMFFLPEKKPLNDQQLMIACANFSFFLTQFGFCSTEEKRKFFDSYLNLEDGFLKNLHPKGAEGDEIKRITKNQPV